MSNKKIAVVLIRGTVNMDVDVRKTLDLLRLRKKHACVVIDDTPANRGMVQAVKDYVTFGTVDEAFFKEMLDKRGELFGHAKLASAKPTDSSKVAKEYFSGKLKLRDFETMGLKPFFRLHPPKGGFERAGIKMPFAKGGVLGDRGDKVSILIAKML